MHARPILVLVTVGLLAGACGSDDDLTSTSTTEAEVTTTTVSPTTAPPTPTTVPFDSTQALWPAPGEPGLATPEQAAVGFARDFLAMFEPGASEFRPGDTRSGEIDVEPGGNGPVTTVLVRQLDGTRWWVIAAVAESIELDDPVARSGIGSPVHVAGRSTAFEATVNVEVRLDGQAEPLGEGFVMGGSMGEMAPFSGDIAFTEPDPDTWGSLVLFEADASGRGAVSAATVMRVHF